MTGREARVLAILDKGHTRAGVEAAIGLTRSAGIALRPSLVPFTPWTGLREYRELLAGRFARRPILDGAHFGEPLARPG